MLLYSNIGTSTAGRYEIVLSAILADFFVERGFVVRMFMLLGYRGHFLLRHVSPVHICLSTHKHAYQTEYSYPVRRFWTGFKQPNYARQGDEGMAWCSN
jgi:hypothetical protein